MRQTEGIHRELIPKIADTLRPYIAEDRLERMEAALRSRTRDVVLVVEDLFDDRNASAVLRTAEALGILEVHCVARKHALRLSRKVTRGAHKWLDLRVHASPTDAYAALRKRGYGIWVADVREPSSPLASLPVREPIALVFGNEHTGPSFEALAGGDGRFRIPMVGFVESLNISVAAGIATYDVLARRAAAGTLKLISDDEQSEVRAAWYAASVRAADLILEKSGLPAPRSLGDGLGFVDEDTENASSGDRVSRAPLAVDRRVRSKRPHGR